MSMYSLPTSLSVGGVGFSIRTSWLIVVERIFPALNDEELTIQEKMDVVLNCLYKEPGKIPSELVEEAVTQAFWYINGGKESKDDGIREPSYYDWEEDADLIIPFVNKSAGEDIRLHPETHWWTVLSYFMSGEGGTFGTVVGIRMKKHRGEKLDQWEKDYVARNSNRFKIKRSKADQEALDAFDAILRGTTKK